ncbi:hypothetical protein O0I10_013032 [Lichtheimia ornata]|uniref:AB hydrolase-1 domain-containing protein n=1 Tax=Lichtheimia ornata TaxID=688661 RepID=A0AAD7XVA4_9FUNG|nr:uncharacterized protein O0I10_013032 [Lichtheimia ornata]KAJ8651427.1 hypothetical protein O0I10_013032 [Lichtheimia ornata]
MPRLIPSEEFTIPVHQSTPGWDTEQLVVEKHAYPAPSNTSQERIAFLWAHANGFSKEMMHPLMRRFATQLRSLPSFQSITFDFYGFDARYSGDSACLNNGHPFNPKYSWFDNAMDMIQVIKEMELYENYDKVIGVGHSFGACSMMVAEFLFPKTFHALCLIEPVVSPYVFPYEALSQFPAMSLTLKRRDTWPSREACYTSLKDRPFWRDLHPEVFENYVQYALYDTPDGNVKLKCPKEVEHAIYWASLYGSPTVFNSLRCLTIPVHIVHANRSTFTDPSSADDIKELSPLISNALVEGSHVVPLENPDILVPEILHLVNRALETRAKL